MAPKLATRDDLPAVREHIFTRIPRADDLEIHVKLTEVDGEKYVNIREFVPSLNWYGRGLVIPADPLSISMLLDGIAEAAEAA